MIVERHDRAQFGPAHDFAIAADIGGHDRDTAGHGLEEYVGPSFIARGEHEHVGRRQRRLELVRRYGAEKAYGAFDAKALRLLPQLRTDVPFCGGAADDYVM